MERCFTVKSCCMLGAVSAILLAAWTPPARTDEIRTAAMGNCSIALEDRDNQLNPYDFGRNPAYLGSDFDRAWIRFLFSIDEQKGDLKRPFDPHLLNNAFVEFEGRKRLSDRQAAAGSFRYDRLWQREQWHSLELDQYNDPFYLTDLTTGDIKYWGPAVSVDYSLQLSPKAAIGAGFDYEISTGLKDYYTRPQIEHNYAMGNLGLILQPRKEWQLGFIMRPTRLQNRTTFDGTNENKDLTIRRYYGEGIYDIRSFNTYSMNEIMHGLEIGVQNFVTTDRVKVGTIFSYGYTENTILGKTSPPEEIGYWQDKTLDFNLIARYTPESVPLVLGVSGRSMNRDGWAKRPRFEDVILFDNPTQLRSVGAGASYTIQPAGLTVAVDYVLNSYDIEANDYGANNFRAQEFIQNIGRLGVEYAAYNVYSFRGGVEVTDYVADRWLKLPVNTDRYRFTAGGSYAWHLWQVDAMIVYGRDTQNDTDARRRDLGGIVWFTHLE
ncbi:MAG: DUF6850 family outer membrane beta-barrel protein [Candidatus Krumholzibacteriia bacterium]